MVSNKRIKELDFRDINDYYEYVLKSYNNGRHLQVEELIIKMSKDQKMQFMKYLETANWPKPYIHAMNLKIIELL